MTYANARHVLHLAAVVTLCAGTTPTAATDKPVSFHGERAKWTLIVDAEETRFDQRKTRLGQLWTTKEIRADNVKEGAVLNATFWSTHVVAGEAVDQPMSISLSFAAGQCRDRRGRVYPFSVTLRFDENPEAQRGCGSRLP